MKDNKSFWLATACFLNIWRPTLFEGNLNARFKWFMSLQHIWVTGTEIMRKPTLLVLKFTWLLMTDKWIAAIHPSIKIHSFMSNIQQELIVGYNTDADVSTCFVFVSWDVMLHKWRFTTEIGFNASQVTFDIFHTSDFPLCAISDTFHKHLSYLRRSCMGYSSSHSFTMLLF
jgi:hypothetical protein